MYFHRDNYFPQKANLWYIVGKCINNGTKNVANTCVLKPDWCQVRAN